METITLIAPVVPTVTELDTIAASAGWIVLAANQERVIVAPARDQFQFGKDVPTAIGIYSDRVEHHFEGYVETVEAQVNSLGEQLALLMQQQLEEEERKFQAQMSRFRASRAA